MTRDVKFQATWVAFYGLFFFGTFAFVHLFPGAMMSELQHLLTQNELKQKREELLLKDDEGVPRTDFELLMETFEEAYQDDLKFVQAYLAGKNTIVIPEEPKDPPLTPNCFLFCAELRHWITNDFGIFASFINVCVALVLVVLMLDGYDSPTALQVGGKPASGPQTLSTDTTLPCFVLASSALGPALSNRTLVQSSTCALPPSS